MGRRLFRAAALAGLLALVPGAVLAHPLGNFTINHYAGLTIARDAVRLDVVIDMAEIPAFQERQRIDTDEDGEVTDAETAAEAPRACRALRDSLRLAVGGDPVELVAAGASLAFPAGLGGLSTMRLECGYSAPIALTADPTTIEFADTSHSDRIGWREIVATADGPTIDAGDLPATSPSVRLTSYPTDLLTQPLDIRSATIVATAAAGGTVATSPPAAGPATGDGGSVAAVPGGVGGEIPAIFRSVDLTPFVILVSVLTALLLGAQHALTPGHGKTLMAAYLVGSRGRPRHAVGLGLAVSVSHTIGILVLTAVVVGAQGLLPAETVVEVAPVIAAVTIMAIGGWMLVSELRRRGWFGRAGAADHANEHEHGAHERGTHEHEHRTRALEHSHGGVRHSHAPAPGSDLGWRGLIALGLAGGLIPSTSALFILLGSIVAGRPAFGFVLVVVFGLGMAAVMTGVGLAIVFARDRIERASAVPGLRRLARHAPLGAAVVVLAFGLFLTVQAVAGRPVL